MVRALAWRLRVGGPWRALPGGMVPWRTAYGWFPRRSLPRRRWQGLGLFDALMRHVAGLRRRAAGRRPGPRLAVAGTQSAGCVAVRGPRGYDAATKALGRKRVALAGADGTWLAVAVAPGSVQDRDCLGADRGQGSLAAALREAVPDGAFAAERCQAWCNHHGMRRRVVERGFGWLAHWGGLLRDRASRLDLSAARLACVAVLSGVEALVNPTPVHAKAR